MPAMDAKLNVRLNSELGRSEMNIERVPELDVSLFSPADPGRVLVQFDPRLFRSKSSKNNVSPGAAKAADVQSKIEQNRALRMARNMSSGATLIVYERAGGGGKTSRLLVGQNSLVFPVLTEV